MRRLSYALVAALRAAAMVSRIAFLQLYFLRRLSDGSDSEKIA
jgi:hypothetical protein